MIRRNAKNWASGFIEDLLQPPLLHGDDAHQEWLSKELLKNVPELAQLLDDYADEVLAHA